MKKLVLACLLCWVVTALAQGIKGGLNIAVVSMASHTSSLWKLSDTPTNIDSGDATVQVLGVQFAPLINGNVTGCRFFKATTNTGTHVCTLWTSAGVQLASVTFSGETASGWQTQNFSSPVAVTANTQYVIGVFMPAGHYSYNQPQFNNNWCSDVDGALYTPNTGSTTNGNGNGVHVPTTTPTTFPTSTYHATNYWVDVAFQYTGTPAICQTGIQRAHDFLAKLGTNTQVNNPSLTISQILSDFQYLGLTNDRDFIVQFGTLSSFQALAAAGIRLHLEEDGPDDGANSAVPAATFLGWMQTLNSAYPGSLVGISGPNEIDVTLGGFLYGGQNSYPAAVQLQRDVYTGMKSGSYPALTSVPVDILPVANPASGTVQGNIGNLSAYCDRFNMHDYYANNNTTPSTVGGPNGPISVIIVGWQTAVHTMCNKPAFVTTETGYCSGGPSCGTLSFANSDVQAKMLLIDYFDHAMLPNCIAVYIFALQDGMGNANWGFFDSTNTAKESATAVHNLTTVLADTGSTAATFTPGAAAYSLSGMPALSGNTVVAFSNGQFGIILWNETPMWNQSTQTQIPVTPSAVTLKLPAGSTGNVYQPISGLTPISSFMSVSSVSLSLGDSPLIVIFTP
jgi:hypothetical protein